MQTKDVCTKPLKTIEFTWEKNYKTEQYAA